MANIHSAISFGLVNIPIVYSPIIKNNDTSFNQLHKKCLHRIRYQKYCEHCKKIVTEADLIKGYEYEKGEYVTFTKEELSNLQIDSKDSIEIISFVPSEEIDPYYYEKSYILTTPKKSKAYSLFVEVLKKSKKVAVAKTSLSSKFYYCLLRYFEGNILMSTMYFEEEVNIPDAVTEAKFTKQELDLAMKLVSQLSGHFKPEDYQDDYQNSIKEAINEKIEGNTLPKKVKKKKPAMKDLITSLQKVWKCLNMQFGRFFAPMLLEEIENPFDSSNFLYELKFDGARATIHVGPKTFKIFGRRGTDLTNLYPELKQIQELVTENTIFDGEIVLFMNGKPSFSKLQERSHLKDKKKIKYFSENFPVCFMAFDIVYKNKVLTDLSLIERKKILEKCQENDYFVKTKYIIKEGKKLFKQVKKLNLEGIVAKELDSTYEINTRSKNWLKIKNWHDEFFFIGGYTIDPKEPMIKLYLGEYKENNFHFVGKVMAGKKQEIYKKIIKEPTRKTSPFIDFKEEGLHYLKPKFTCEVSYIERTKTNRLRQAVFKR